MFKILSNRHVVKSKNDRSLSLPSPSKDGYLTLNVMLIRILKVIDKLLVILTFFAKNKLTNQNSPKRILLSNIAHMGDVIIATSAINLIRQEFQHIEIGFLAGSWVKPVLEKHPLLNFVHYFDHFYCNRSKLSIINKIVLHLRSRRRALKEIKANKYDVAIDLRPYFPNTILLLWQAKIPRRIAYNSAGFGALLTDSIPWKLKDQHVACYHFDLIRILFPQLPKNYPLKQVIPRNEHIDIKKFFPQNIPGDYIICHPSSGSVLRNWPIDKWIALKEKLLLEYQLVFTGLGEAELSLVNAIIGYSKKCINLCNKLKWEELVEVIAQASCILSSDTGASHVAAAVNTPSVVICGGMVNYVHWQPLSNLVKVLHKNMECYPCYSFCEKMACIHDVSANEVYNAILEMQLSRREDRKSSITFLKP